jgi:hypothetical protein
MSTTFKKGWYLGKPLRQLLPNTKQFRFWYLGNVYPLFDKPSTPTTPITIPIDAPLHLTLSLNAPTVRFGYTVQISTCQSLTLSPFDAEGRAGFVAIPKVTATGTSILYVPGIGIINIATGLSTLYAPEIKTFVSQVVAQVEFCDTLIDIAQAGAAIVYEEIPRVDIAQAGAAIVYEEIPHVDIAQAGVVVVYNLDGVFLVNKVSLVLSLNAPTIIAIQMGECDKLSLTLALHAPFITTTFSVLAEVVQKHLTFSLFSPAVHQGCSVSVSLKSLILTAHEPLALIGACVSETLEAHLAIFSPTINLSSIITISKLSLYLSLKAPTINYNRIVEIATTLPLVFTVYTPEMRGGVNLSETLSLNLSQYAPSLTWGYNVLISAPKHLVFSLKTTTVIVTSNAVNLVQLQSLNLDSKDVEALMGASIKETLYLILDKLEPFIQTSSIITVNTLHLVLTKLTPSIHIKTVNEVNIQSLVFNAYDASVILGYVIKETLNLRLTEYAVTISYGATMTPDPLTLHLTIYDPDAIALPFLPYVVDPLHKERQWGSSYDLGEGEYASRSGSALSSGFPLQSSDDDKQITVCCWVRFKSLPGRQSIFDKLVDNGSPSNVSLGLHMLGSHPSLVWGRTSTYASTYNFDEITVVIDRWYHFGLAVDGKERSVYFQVWDDKAKTSQTMRWSSDAYGVCPPVELYLGSGNFNVGYVNERNVGDQWFDGYLDELVIFNKLKSPYEMDQIRRGHFNGPEQGQTVGDFALTTAYDPIGTVTVFDYSTAVGYSPAGNITTSDYALTVAYRVEVPPPPSRFPVISGFPSPGSGTTSYSFCNITYKFKSDVFSYDLGTNLEARTSQYTLPNRELETMIGIADESAYLRLWETLMAGATIYSVPMWAHRTFLTVNAHAADLEFAAEDVSNIYVGEKVLLVRANDATIYDLCDVTSIAGSTVHIATPLTLHYHKFQMPTNEVRYDARSSYVVPCITGFVDANDVELRGSKPTWALKVRVNGGAWFNAGQPEIVNYMEPPAEAGYISPKVEHTVVGTENGLIEMMPHMLTSKLAFQVEWYFIDDSWKLLRNHFIAAKGKAITIPMPTWCYELRATTNRLTGDVDIQLTHGFEEIWKRFPRLYALPLDGTSPFVINLRTAITDEIPWYSWNYSESEHRIAVSGFIDYYPEPGTLHLVYNIPGVDTHDIVDDGEGNLVGEGVSAGHIIYSGRTFYFFLDVTDPVSFNITASYSYIPLGNIYACLPLEQNIKVGDKISLYPNVRFMEDELTFEFIYYNQCKVKASFIEVVD